MDPDELQRTEGNLTYWASRRTVIGIGTPVAPLYVCQIVFNKRDGSVFVLFPHFRQRDGIATVVRLGDGGAARKSVSFTDEGKVTSHLVKYSHHPDGRVHFSQDAKVRTEIRRQAKFRLDGPIGKLFQLHALFPVGGFLPLDESTMRSGRPHLVFNYPQEIPSAVRIAAEWRRKVDVASWSEPTGTPIGPKERLQHRVTGGRGGAYFLGQPDGYPLQEHLMVIFCDRVDVPTGVARPMIIFTAGADADEVKRTGDVAPPSEYLAATYPVADRAAMERVVGTIDFHPIE